MSFWIQLLFHWPNFAADGFEDSDLSVSSLLDVTSRGVKSFYLLQVNCIWISLMLNWDTSFRMQIYSKIVYLTSQSQRNIFMPYFIVYCLCYDSKSTNLVAQWSDVLLNPILFHWPKSSAETVKSLFIAVVHCEVTGCQTTTTTMMLFKSCSIGIESANLEDYCICNISITNRAEVTFWSLFLLVFVCDHYYSRMRLWIDSKLSDLCSTLI